MKGMHDTQPKFKPHRIINNQGSLWTRLRALTDPLWDALCHCELTSPQRRALCGGLFPGVKEFVSALAEGMAHEPELFAHIPISPTDLIDEQDGAMDLLFLSFCLSQLAQLAYDAYLQQEGSVVERARAVLRQVTIEGQQPFLSPEQRRAHRRRELLLSAAQKVLTDRQRILQRAARKSKPRAR